MKRIVIIIFFLIALGCSKHTLNFPSPSGRWEISVSQVKEGTLFRIVDVQSNQASTLWLFESFFGFNLVWKNDNTVLIDTDLGPKIFEFQGGQWKSRDPLVSFSPYKKYGCFVFNHPRKGFAVVNIFQIFSSGARRTVKEFELKEKIVNLADCSRWIDDETVVITADRMVLYVHRDADGIWSVEEN